MSDRSTIFGLDFLSSKEEEDNENEKLRDFYERNLPFLKEYPLKHDLAKMARMINRTLCNPKVEWMEYAVTLGITDPDVIDKVEERAEQHNEPQLFIVFTRVLPRTKKFDHLIRMLIKHNRFDVLKEFHPVAERLIKESLERNAKECLMIEPEYGSEGLASTPCSIHELDSETSSNSSNGCKLNATCVQDPPSHVRKEIDDLQQCSPNDSFRREGRIPDSTVFCGKQDLASEKEIAPSAPPVQENPEQKINVFIQHTKLDTDYARKLSAKFKSAGLKVTATSDMDLALAINEIEALSTIYQEVDFIVPVISENLLKQIHAPNAQFDSDDAENNKFLYQLIMQDYKKNKCHNYKVRPVIVPGMPKQKLKKDVVFSFSFRFGAEDDKLIRVLKETKDIISQYYSRMHNG